jgi:hypothetical protein
MSGAASSQRSYELTVAGAIGSVLRAALPAHRAATQGPCTVLRVEDGHGRTLDELLGLLTAADVTVEEIRRWP